jgi:enamine deaminase RidA (YjgF/YER057c/UK114 family)
VVLGLVIAAVVFAGKKKDPDDTTQVLDLPKDPPLVAIGETSRLVFHVSPLSAKGLLTQQTRDALKAILKMNGGAPVVHIRAFVAGSGDVRRVPQIASEVFSEKRMPLPSVSVIQAGALPLEGAQVVLETVSEAKRPVNPDGLTFMEATNPDAVATPVAVTCYVSNLASAATIASRFAGAAVDVVQTQRVPGSAAPQCEAIVRGGNVRAAKLGFTGTHVAPGTDEKATRLAFQRMDRALTEAGVQPADIVMTHLYPLSARIGETARTIRATPGPLSVITVEGVAGIDGAFAVDAIAALK